MSTMRAIAAWFTFRRRVVAAALIGWAVLVVIGAGRSPESDQWIVVPDLGSIFLAVLGIYAVIALVVLAWLRPVRSRTGARPKSMRALLIIIILFVGFAFLFPPSEVAQPEPQVEPEPAFTQQEAETTTGDDARPAASGTDIAVLLLILLVVGAVLLRSRRRSTEPTLEFEDAAEELLEEDIGPAVDEATERLQLETDPRLAVLAAYASLEQALAERGHHRDLAQTPSEHLADVLAAMPVLVGPAVRLGHLYELARFSDHAITNDDRERAADALARARLDLAAPAGDAS